VGAGGGDEPVRTATVLPGASREAGRCAAVSAVTPVPDGERRFAGGVRRFDIRPSTTRAHSKRIDPGLRQARTRSVCSLRSAKPLIRRTHARGDCVLLPICGYALHSEVRRETGRSATWGGQLYALVRRHLPGRLNRTAHDKGNGSGCRRTGAGEGDHCAGLICQVA
jgi:hypothetical protein